jgi:hypothetical protein
MQSKFVEAGPLSAGVSDAYAQQHAWQPASGKKHDANYLYRDYNQ